MAFRIGRAQEGHNFLEGVRDFRRVSDILFQSKSLHKFSVSWLGRLIISDIRHRYPSNVPIPVTDTLVNFRRAHRSVSDLCYRRE